MTPAEELRAAADLIERTGAAVNTLGPWGNDMGYVETANGSVVIDAGYGDATWIALLGPDTAPALAAWLRAEAVEWEYVVELQGCPVPHALAFARRILRGQPIS